MVNSNRPEGHEHYVFEKLGFSNPVEIGQGSTAKVFKGKDRRRGVAVKICKEQQGFDQLRAFEDTKGIDGTVTYDYHKLLKIGDHTVMAIVMPLMVDTLAGAMKKTNVDGKMMRLVIKSLLWVYSRLDKHNLTLRDVKPSNIMIDRFQQIKISTAKAKEKTNDRLGNDYWNLHFKVQSMFPRGTPSWLICCWSDYTLRELLHNKNDLPLEELRISLPDLLLAFPGFWTADKAIEFLVRIGSCELQSKVPRCQELLDAVEECIAGQSAQSWHDHFSDMEQEEHPTWDQQRRDPFQLFVFLRNKYMHFNHENMKSEIRVQLRNKDEVLDKLPKLVMKCWKALLPNLLDFQPDDPELVKKFFCDRVNPDDSDSG